MQWIDTSDLQLWANKPASKAGLPELISRLIRSTTNNITDLQIPKGSQTYRGGWDGIVYSKVETEFIPEGISLWEFGTESSPKGKANKDYAKRTADPHGENPADVTVVFVTPRVWEAKDEWIAEKIAEGLWKDIKVYDAGKLVEWLTLAPVQHHWIASEIGRAPNDGFIATSDFWDDWSIGPKYQLPPQIITAGRVQQTQELQKKLAGNPAIIPIKAASREEAIAFFVGSVMQMDTEQQEYILSRNLIVEDAGVFKQLTTNYNSLILIVKFESSGGFHKAIDKKHFVIVPMGSDETSTIPETIVLPKLGREEFINALISVELSDEKAQILSKESGRNITVLRRRESFGANSLPDWAKPENARELIPALLLGKWSEDKEGDRMLLESLANGTYDSYIATLAKWKNIPDTPIYQIGSKWRLASPLDAWSHLAKFLTSADIDALRKAILSAAKQVKPMFDLEPNQRYMASVYGKSFSYSSWAREGVAQSIILVALFGESFGVILSSPQLWADGIVADILQDANEDLFCSLSDLLRPLSEASPTSFMKGIESSLASDLPTVLSLFQETESLITPTSYHAELLWALEGIAWLPEYLSRSAIILARLAAEDPGGKTSNRPINSLRSIFLPWNPQTLASVSKRVDALKRLKNMVPDIAWKLCIMLLPKAHDHNSPTNTFRWRLNEKGDAPYATYAELFQCYSEIIDLLLDFAGDDEKRILDLIGEIPELQLHDRGKVVKFVESKIESIVDGDQAIQNCLREMLHRHRSCSETDWAMKESELEPLERLYKKLTPSSIVEKYKWMFMNSWLQMPDAGLRKLSHEERHKFIVEKRVSALHEIQNEIGFASTLELVNVYNPQVLGDIIGYMLENEDALHEAFIYFGLDEERRLHALQAMLFRVYWLKGLDWAINLYNRLLAKGASTLSLSKVLNPLPISAELWNFVESIDSTVRDEYWMQVNPWFGLLDVDNKIKCYRKLLLYKRFPTALQSACYDDDVPSDVLLEILDKLATEKSSEPIEIDHYAVTHLFDTLDKRKDIAVDTLARLELLYIPILCRVGSSREPKLLYKEICDNPASFIMILKWGFKPKDETLTANENDELTEEQLRLRSQSACDLIFSWRRIPGSDEEGNINYDHLNKWIGEVRELALGASRLNAADAAIGKVLATHRDTDPEWPGDGICKIIDTLNSDSLCRNFKSGIFNRYGSTTRGAFDGGAIERRRAVRFRSLSQLHAAKWPLTASILERLAIEYDAMAKEEDTRAQQDESEY